MFRRKVAVMTSLHTWYSIPFVSETTLEQLANKHHVPEIFQVDSELTRFDKDAQPIADNVDMMTVKEGSALEVGVPYVFANQWWPLGIGCEARQ